MQLTQQTRIDLSGLTANEVLSGGVNNAINGLSKMVGKDIKVSNLSCRKIAVKEIPALFGGPETYIVGVYLGICGDSSGHIFVAYQPNTAFELIDLLLGQPSGSTGGLSEMEISVLGEVGNIMGSFFLNYVSDSINARLTPSPPAVMMDMAGAILDGALASIMEFYDSIYVVETVFGTSDRSVMGNFLVAIM